MKVRLGVLGLLCVQVWLTFSTLAVTSPTVDEPLHMVRGYAFVARGEDRLRLRGPVLSNALSGLALLLEPELQLPPAADPIWLEQDGTQLPEDFAWANTAPPLRMVFLARLPMLLVSVLLGALIFRWAAQRSGSQARIHAFSIGESDPSAAMVELARQTGGKALRLTAGELKRFSSGRDE